eukprot:31701_1
MDAFLYHLFSKEEGLFSEERMKSYLTHYILQVFDFKKWTYSIGEDLNDLIHGEKKKFIARIKKKLISTTKISKLLAKIKEDCMPCLSDLQGLTCAGFRNQIILFMRDYLIVYNKYKNTHYTELIHKILFNGNEKDYRCIKILMDVAWHLKGSENMAETALKAVGWIYGLNSQRMKFEKMVKRSMVQKWLPDYKYYDVLKKDILQQCKVDDIRGMKTDSRALPESVALRNLAKEKTYNRMPYGNY